MLLCSLSLRRSQKTGKSYLSGWLGKSRLIAFQSAEPDRFGNPCFDVVLQAVPEPRPEERRERELVAVNGNER